MSTVWTLYTLQFIVGTGIAWVAGVTFMSLDLAMDITGHPHGISAAHFFLTLIFPAIAVLLYLVLVSILIFRKLDDYKSLIYVALALITFTISQVILFGASSKIAAATHGRVNGSIFSTFFDLVSVALLYRFWNSITDGKCYKIIVE
ncbi:hypothetical protein BGZ58_008138 [Dissophora ornata]|nr:hypothetical protein BGZ58_008138 [Dissophora ornata]